MDYKIITDSSGDLPAWLCEELDINVIPMKITIGGFAFNHYADEREMSIAEFYKRLRAGEKPETAAASPNGWIEEMEKFLPAGRDVLLIAFSSGLSSTYDSACLAAMDMREKYPERQIEVVDSLGASMGQGFFCRAAAWKRNEGLSLKEIKEHLDNYKYRVCHYFTVDDLAHLRRGGRISATTAVVGSALGIKPILHVDDGGFLINIGKTRGRKNALTALLDHMQELVVDPENQHVMLAHADCRQDADELALEIKRRFNVKDVLVDYIGPVAGAHTGAATMALFFEGKKR